MVEPPFAALRLRTDATKRFKKVANATAVVWKMLLVAERKFRRINSPELLPAVAAGQQYHDGLPIRGGQHPRGRRLICFEAIALSVSAMPAMR